MFRSQEGIERLGKEAFGGVGGTDRFLVKKTPSK